MSCLLGRVKRFLSDESGPTAVEYAVMLAIIVVTCMAAIQELGNVANTTFTGAADAAGGQVGGAGGGAGC